MPSVRPAGQPAHSPGQSEAAPWVMNPQQCFRPARAKAYIIGAMYGRIVNAGSYAFALAGRKVGMDKKVGVLTIILLFLYPVVLKAFDCD